jgi:hypothetical protein
MLTVEELRKRSHEAGALVAELEKLEAADPYAGGMDIRMREWGTSQELLREALLKEVIEVGRRHLIADRRQKLDRVLSLRHHVRALSEDVAGGELPVPTSFSTGDPFMSWSFSCFGKPENVAAAIDKYGETLNGQSKIEFEDAKPHLIALVNQNFAKEAPYSVPTIKFSASGSGSAKSAPGITEQVQRCCTVSVETLWAQLV